MKPRTRIIASLTKLIQDAANTERAFDTKRAKRGSLADAIAMYGDEVRITSILSAHATDMLNQFNMLDDPAFEAKVNELVAWYVGEIVRNRADRPDRLIELAAHKRGYDALVNLHSLHS